jgi:HEAT repeat protein
MVLSRLEELSVESVKHVRLAALKALTKLLADGAGPIELLLNRILSMLDDPEPEVRRIALEAVPNLGEAAHTATLSAKLAKALQDESLLEPATKAVAKLGRAITQDHLDALFRLFSKGDWRSQHAAARCLELMMLSGWRFFGEGVDKLRLLNINDLSS